MVDRGYNCKLNPDDYLEVDYSIPNDGISITVYEHESESSVTLSWKTLQKLIKDLSELLSIHAQDSNDQREVGILNIKPLTQYQSKVLEFIKREVLKHGFPPTIREISKYMNYESSSTAFNIVEQLARKGYILKGEGPRTISIVDKMQPIKKIHLASSCENAEQVTYFSELLVEYGYDIDFSNNTNTGCYVQIEQCDALILIGPLTDSEYFLAGYAAGVGKKIIIYQDNNLIDNTHVMLELANLISNDFKKILNYLSTQE